MGLIGLVGIVCILLGFLFFFLGSREEGAMDIEMGSFRGPVWFLLIILGIALIVLDVTIVSRIPFFP